MTRAERSAAAEREIRAMTRRLVRLHAATTPAELASGLAWYGRGESACRLMAHAEAWDDVVRAASMLAHLSAGTGWQQNLAACAAMLDAAAAGEPCPRVGRFPLQRAKAWAVAMGEADPWARHGLKTADFMASLLGDVNRPCIDRHAARAATGDPSIESVSDALYRRCSEAYKRAARIVGMSPRDLQAAIWVHVRGSAD